MKQIKDFGKGSWVLGSLISFLEVKHVSEAEKLRIYETIIQLTILYAYKTTNQWKVNEIPIWKKKVLQKIFREINVTEGAQKRQTHNEIMEATRRPKITQKIRAERTR